MSTHHQRLAKGHTGAIKHAREVWVPNSCGMRQSSGWEAEGVVLVAGFSKDLVAFIRRRRQVQRWIPREALTTRKPARPAGSAHGT